MIHVTTFHVFRFRVMSGNDFIVVRNEFMSPPPYFRGLECKDKNQDLLLFQETYKKIVLKIHCCQSTIRPLFCIKIVK